MQSSFVKDIREKRKDEMSQYEKKGYIFSDKAKYYLTDTIFVLLSSYVVLIIIIVTVVIEEKY